MSQQLKYQLGFDKVRELVKAGEEVKVIDFICGRGVYTEKFSDAGFDVISLIDPYGQFSEIELKTYPWMEHARQGISVISKPIHEFIIPYRSTDAIWCHRAFANTNRNDTIRTLEIMYDWLKKGGYIYFCVPEGEGYKYNERETPEGRKREIVMYYQPEEIEEMVRLLGYETIDAWYEGKVGNRWIHVILKRPIV